MPLHIRFEWRISFVSIECSLLITYLQGISGFVMQQEEPGEFELGD